jgi:hypothetical protein
VVETSTVPSPEPGRPLPSFALQRAGRLPYPRSREWNAVVSGEPVDITFGDRVRVLCTSETEAAGVAGLQGQVHGVTTPSVTGVEIIGTPDEDAALNVHFESLNQAHWFAPHLLELVDHGPGTELRLEGVDVKWVRSADGAWIEESTAQPKRPWWRFW